MYGDTTNVEPEMHGYTSNNWNHWNSNKKLKEKFGNCTRKTFDRFTTEDSYTRNITHNTESTAVWSLKPEQWGSPLVQEKYREEKACDKRQPYNNDNNYTSAISAPLENEERRAEYHFPFVGLHLARIPHAIRTSRQTHSPIYGLAVLQIIVSVKYLAQSRP